MLSMYEVILGFKFKKVELGLVWLQPTCLMGLVLKKKEIEKHIFPIFVFRSRAGVFSLASAEQC